MTRPDRPRTSSRVRCRIGSVVATTLVLLVGLLAAGGPSPTRPDSGSGAGPSTEEAPSDCSSAGLAALTMAPGSANVSPLENRVFSAVALNACGSPVVGVTNVSWWLSNPALGLLNATNGASVAYTACLAPMAGVLHVRATNGGITLYANASITVTLQNPGWEGSGSSASAGGSPPPSAAESPGVRQTLEFGVAVLVGLGLLSVGYLRGRRPKEEHGG